MPPNPQLQLHPETLPPKPNLLLDNRIHPTLLIIKTNPNRLDILTPPSPPSDLHAPPLLLLDPLPRRGFHNHRIDLHPPNRPRSTFFVCRIRLIVKSRSKRSFCPFLPHLNPLNPLHAIRPKPPRHHQPNGSSVLCRQRLTIHFPGE